MEHLPAIFEYFTVPYLIAIVPVAIAALMGGFILILSTKEDDSKH